MTLNSHQKWCCSQWYLHIPDSLWMFFWAFDIIDKVLLNNGVFNGFASVAHFFLANTIIRYSDCQANKIIHGVLLTFIPSSQTSGIQWNINFSSTAYDDIPIDYLEHFKGFIVCFMNARHAPNFVLTFTFTFLWNAALE